MPLRQNARGLQREDAEHQRAHHDAVPAERREVVLLNVPHQELDGHQGHDERRNHAHCENPNAEAMHEKYDAFVIEASMRSSDTEVRAITIERNADDCYKAEYMQQHLGEIFDGIIAGVTDFGFYVALPNTVEGLVHVSTLPESDWINDDSIAFKEEQGSACYRLGDTVRVQCTKIDVNSGNVDFALVEEGQEAAAK